MRRAKVFGIGLSKTGTTSLASALTILGFRTIDFDLGLRRIDEFDASTDLPAADGFEELDARYPGARFIYTTRNIDDWLRSMEINWKYYVSRIDQSDELQALLFRSFGTPDFDPMLFEDAYHRHDARVRAYFANRPDDLLTINLCRSPSWEPLCRFLDRPIPSESFPHSNPAIPKHNRLLIRAGVPARYLVFNKRPPIRAMFRDARRWLKRRVRQMLVGA